MNYTISQEAMNRSSKCNLGFACQRPGWQPCGTVKKIISERLLEVDGAASRGRTCYYGVPYGSGFYCTCPARMEIFRNYGV